MINDAQSMREMQRQVPRRQDMKGNPIPQPRLASQERPKAEENQEQQQNQKKSSGAKWAWIIGSAVIGSSITSTILFT